MGENKALEGLIWVNSKVLVLLFFTKVKWARFGSILELLEVAAEVLSIINFVPLSFVVINRLAKVVAIPKAEVGVKRSLSLNSHLIVIAVHVGLPLILVNINIGWEIFVGMDIWILLFGRPSSEEVTRVSIISVIFIITAKDVAWGVNVFTSASLHFPTFQEALVLGEPAFVVIVLP